MTKSELIEQLIDRHPELSVKDVELAVKMMLDHMTESLAHGERIEIRGFGVFDSKFRTSRKAINPKNKNIVDLDNRYNPSFKPSKQLNQKLSLKLSK